MLKIRIRDWVNQKWLEEVMHKPTLKWYREGKFNIQYDMCYNNSTSSDYLAKARTNTLHLEEYHARRNRNHDKTCRLCGQAEEDLEHFLVVCPSLETKRDREIMEVWQSNDTKKQTVDILFNEKIFDKTGGMIKSLWLHRKDLLRPP